MKMDLKTEESRGLLGLLDPWR